MAKETEKIRLPELPIFKKYSLAVRQEFATPAELLAALERTTVRIEKLVAKAEDQRRRKEQAERSEADRVALADQERRWADENQEAGDESQSPVDPATEKLVFEEQYLSEDRKQVEDDYDARPFWEVDEAEPQQPSESAPVPALEESLPQPADSARPKPKPRKKARPRPQVVPVSGKGKPMPTGARKGAARKPASRKPAKRKPAKTTAKKKTGKKRKTKR